jgi:sterol desaturase/sphingolipid hydroxylase (fatty acid hydroxylase superfamily)
LLWKYHRNHHHGTVQVAKSLDAYILEHLVANLGSFIVGFLVLQYVGIIFNIYLFHVWVVVSTVSTCISHADKRILGDAGVHAIHHKHLKYNYGTGFYIMDRIMGTYRK